MAEVRASDRAGPPIKELFLIILMHMMNRDVNPRQVKGLTVSSIKCDRCGALISSVKVSAALQFHEILCTLSVAMACLPHSTGSVCTFGFCGCHHVFTQWHQ